jgi:DNA mismatch repair ATPase MutS
MHEICSKTNFSRALSIGLESAEFWILYTYFFKYLILFSIDAATARNLELILNARNFGSDHCLYGVMNHTKTTAGGSYSYAMLYNPFFS